jgi:hypothetical protein
VGNEPAAISPSTSQRARVREVTKRATRVGGLALAATIASLVLFHSVFEHPNSTVLLLPGDASSAARDYWAAAAQHRSPFTFAHDNYLAAPEGQARAPAVQIANAVEPIFISSIGRAVGYLTAVNLFWLLGLVASSLTMAALFRRLQIHWIGALTGTIGFVMCEWEFEQLLYGHVAFAHLWVFPGTVLALLWARQGTAWRAVLPASVIIASFYVSSYFGLLVAGMTAVLLIALVSVGRQTAGEDQVLLRLLIGAATVAIGLAPVALAPRLAPSSMLGLPPTTRSGLNGANLSNYITPSSHNALYGHVLHLANANYVGENALYFGIGLIGLGLIGAVLTIRTKTLDPDRLLTQRFALILLPAAYLMALPAYASIGGKHVPLPDPAYVIGGIVSWWRFYIRFGLLVGFALSLLAAVTIDRAVRSLPKLGRTVGLACLVVVALEALPFTSVPTSRLRPSPVVAWLASHPGGIVAVYPMVAANTAGTSANPIWDNHVWGSLFAQITHGHPLYDLPAIQLTAQRANAIRLLTSDLRQGTAAPLLRAENVRYVVLDDAVYRSLGQHPPAHPKGLRQIATVGGSRIFLVTARARAVDAALDAQRVEVARAYSEGSPTVKFVSGAFGDELYQGVTARWLGQDAIAHLSSSILQPFVEYRLTFNGFSNAVPRRLEIFDGSTRIASFLVGTSESPFDTIIHLSGPDLRFHAEPGPQVLSSTDSRDTSIYVTRLTLDPIAAELQPQ